MAFVPWRTDSDELIDVSPMDRRVRLSRFTRRQLVLGVLGFVGVTVGILAIYHFAFTRTATIDLQRVVISTVEQRAFEDYVPITGNVQPRQTVYLDAVDGGSVAEVFAEEGAFVSSSQPLVKLTNTNLQLQVIGSEAQLSEQLNRLTSTKLLFEQTKLTHARELIDASYRIDELQVRLTRLQSLVATGAIRRAEIEDTQLELRRLERLRAELTHATNVDARLQREQIEQLDLTVEGLHANLALARRNLENLVIRAPFDGQLTALDAHIGQSKLPGQRLGQVDQVDGFKVAALVDEHYLARVTAGQSAIAEIDDSEHALEVTKVYPEVRNRQFKIDLAFRPTPPAAVRRGQTLQVRLKVGASRQGLVVANGAFFDDSGGQWAFVLAARGIAERRSIQAGRRNPEYIEIVSGARQGERIITSSYEAFRDFDRIRLREP